NPRFAGTLRDPGIAEPSHQNRRQGDVASPQMLDDVKAAERRHVIVDDETIGQALAELVEPIEQLASRSAVTHLEAAALENELQRVAHRVVVVDDYHGRSQPCSSFADRPEARGLSKPISEGKVRSRNKDKPLYGRAPLGSRLSHL